jgi:plastocyanin
MNKSAGILALVAIVMVIGIGAVALTRGDNNSSSHLDSARQSESSTAIPANNETTPEAIVNSDVIVDIVGSNFEFSENKINAKPGDIVTVEYSVDGGSHDFVIDALGVQSDVLSGDDSTTVTFTIPEDAAGETYSFYCSIGNHRAQGMEGQLVISE